MNILVYVCGEALWCSFLVSRTIDLTQNVSTVLPLVAGQEGLAIGSGDERFAGKEIRRAPQGGGLQSRLQPPCRWTLRPERLLRLRPATVPSSQARETHSCSSLGPHPETTTSNASAVTEVFSGGARGRGGGTAPDPPAPLSAESAGLSRGGPAATRGGAASALARGPGHSRAREP